MEYFLNFILLLSAVTWCCTSSFAKYIRYQCNSWSSLSYHYKLLHALAAHVNQSISLLAFWWLTGSIFLYPLSIEVIFLKKSTGGVIQFNHVLSLAYWLMAGVLTSCAGGQACMNVSKLFQIHLH